MDRIGIRELRQYASEFVRRVARGESFEVTDRGRLVARLVPIESESVLERLSSAGKLTEAKGDLLEGPEPLRLPKGARLGSQILEELRRDER